MDEQTVDEYFAKWKALYRFGGNCAEEQDAWDLYCLAKKAYEAKHENLSGAIDGQADA